MKRPRIITRLRRKIASCYGSPVETRLVQVLGGTTLTIGRLRDKQTGHPFTLVLSRGRLLRSERFRRAVVDGDGMLANDVKWAIALQGPAYERDVVMAYEQDEFMNAAGWRIRYIPTAMLWNNPGKVRAIVRQFITT